MEKIVAERRKLEWHLEGLIGGAIGAVTIAAWFFLLDLLEGRPLYTPTVLGTHLFRSGPPAASYRDLHPEVFMALLFTLLHFLVFGLIGGAAAWLLMKAETNPNLGFGIILLFVIFEFGFVAFGMLFAQPVLEVLAWPAVLVGNLLAAGAMAAYFRRQHSKLVILP